MSTQEIKTDALENETPKAKINKNLNQLKVDGSNIEWLEKENALDHLDETNLEIVSSKFKKDREIEVQKGLEILKNLEINGTKLNPLIILLGKFWEHKPIRKEVKALIDKEAEELGYDPVDYLQNVLGSQIEKFAEIQTAIDRIKYAKTYFIPRGTHKVTIKTTPMSIDGEIWNVPIVKLNEFKSLYPKYKTSKKDAEAMKAAIKEVSELNDGIESL